jgi:hypothetical protein
VVSFVLDDPPMASHDIGIILDMEGVAVAPVITAASRAMDRLGFPRRRFRWRCTTRARISTRLVQAAFRRRAGQRKPRRGCARCHDARGRNQVSQGDRAHRSQAADAAADDFDILGESSAKNEYVLDLGAKLPGLFDL